MDDAGNKSDEKFAMLLRRYTDNRVPMSLLGLVATTGVGARRASTRFMTRRTHRGATASTEPATCFASVPALAGSPLKARKGCHFAEIAS
jgi:hypothetical protein